MYIALVLYFNHIDPYISFGHIKYMYIMYIILYRLVLHSDLVTEVFWSFCMCGILSFEFMMLLLDVFYCFVFTLIVSWTLPVKIFIYIKHHAPAVVQILFLSHEAVCVALFVDNRSLYDPVL